MELRLSIQSKNLQIFLLPITIISIVSPFKSLKFYKQGNKKVVEVKEWKSCCNHVTPSLSKKFIIALEDKSLRFSILFQNLLSSTLSPSGEERKAHIEGG